MAAPLPLRSDYDAPKLRQEARVSRDPGQVRRLLAVASIYDGQTRTQAAAIGGVGLQTVRDWVSWFNAEGPAGLKTGKAPGKEPVLKDHHRAALRAIVETGPTPSVHGVVRWRIADLMQWLWDTFQVSISKQTMSRELRAMGFRKLSVRPRHHAQDPEAVAGFKKTLPRGWRTSKRVSPPARP